MRRIGTRRPVGGRKRSTCLRCAVLVGLTAMLFAGCRQSLKDDPNDCCGPRPAVLTTGFPREIGDGRGKNLTLAAPPRRIVSLAPNLTEILYALDLQDRLVLDTTACDYPPAAKTKPHVDMFNGSVEAIIACNPDLVIGVDRIDDRMIAAAQKARLPTLVVKADTVQDVYDAIGTIGRATDADHRAALAIDLLQTRMSHIAAAVQGALPLPKVLMMYQANPIYTTGTDSFINDLIRIAGGINIVDKPLKSEVISSELVLTLGPDVIVCSPLVAAQARQLPGWAEGVPAVRTGRFYTAEDSLVRPGPRMAEAAEALARYLHPNRFTRSPDGTRR